MKRLTISVGDDVAEKAQRAVDSGHADSVSGYFGQLAEREPDWALAAETVDAMLAEGAPMDDADRDWARGLLGVDEASTAAK